MEPLRMLHFLTLTIFKAKHFLAMHIQKLFRQLMSPANLPRLARHRRGVALVSLARRAYNHRIPTPRDAILFGSCGLCECTQNFLINKRYIDKLENF